MVLLIQIRPFIPAKKKNVHTILNHTTCFEFVKRMNNNCDNDHICVQGTGYTIGRAVIVNDMLEY